MRRNPGEWLRNLLADRYIGVGLLVAMGWAWLCGAVVSMWIGLGLQFFREWTSLISLLPGIACLGLAQLKWKSGWGALDMKKGAYAEETIGQAIEFALTRDSCAVAHHVEGKESPRSATSTTWW